MKERDPGLRSLGSRVDRGIEKVRHVLRRLSELFRAPGSGACQRRDRIHSAVHTFNLYRAGGRESDVPLQTFKHNFCELTPKHNI